MPLNLITEVPVTLAKPHIDLYKKLVSERILKIGDEVIDATQGSSLYQKMQRMLLCPKNFAETRSTRNALVESLDELVHSLGGRKLLMYVWFNDSIDKLAEQFKKLNPAQLKGSMSGKDREIQKMKFIEDNSCRLMLANVRSGGVGIDGWQNVCSHIAFAEVCPIPGPSSKPWGGCTGPGRNPKPSTSTCSPHCRRWR